MAVKLRTVVIAILLMLALAAGGAGLFVYAGLYNISATEQHTSPVYKLLEYAMLRSVKVRTGSITVPELGSEQRISSGLAHYREHCLQCHGAPGISPHTLAFGMTPAPVNLVSTAREWKPAEIYWVIKHGIKMSGMPAWEYHLSDEDIWNLVAFVEAMPAMSPVEYATLSKSVPDRHRHEDQAHKHQPAAIAGSAAALAPPSAPATDPDPLPSPALGSVDAGRRAVAQYLCATCHEIPGIVGANRHVGPPLNGIGNRRYIAGIMLNNPENMVRWLMNPHKYDPLSAMPDLGVNEKDARDIAAYLYTLNDLE
jgi:mono/diheme cytochrome c family protein